MSTELERRQPQDIDATYRLAKGFALSGYFQDAKSAEQAFVKILAGAEMGLSPFQSMTGIHVIKGKPVVGSGLLTAMIDQHAEYDYETAWEPDQANATACTVTILKGGVVRGSSRFSLDDAKRAGLVVPGGNWEKYPTNMLFARAMSNAVRFYAAGVAGQSVYVEGDGLLDDVPMPTSPPALVMGDAPSDEEIIDVDGEEDTTFETASATPAGTAAENPTEAANLEDQTDASADEKPAAATSRTGGGLLIDSVDAAKAVIRALDVKQKPALVELLHLESPVTLNVVAAALFDQRADWYAEDVLREIGL